MSSYPFQDEYYEYLLDWCKKGISAGSEFVQVDEILLHYGVELNGNFETRFCQALTAEVLATKAALEPELVLTNHVSTPVEESLPFAESRSAEIIVEALRFKDWRLVKEAFRILKNQKKRLHPWCLPAILDQSQAKSDFLLHLRYIMGERARWLAGQKDEWTWWLDLQATEGTHLPSKELLSWILWHRPFGPDLENAIPLLDDKDRKSLLAEMSKTPIESDVALARPYTSSRSPIEKSLAWEVLLKSDTEERAAMLDQVRFFCQNQIVRGKKHLAFIEDDALLEEPSFSEIVIKGSEDFLPDPRLRILALFPLDILFGHLGMSVNEICHDLLLQRKLESICQVAVLSSAISQGAADWKSTLLATWIQEYPKSNTTEVDFGPLLEHVSFELFQKLIKQVLQEKGEYLLEKINLLTRDTDQYIDQETSMKLVDTILQSLDNRLSRKDNQFMIEALGNLAYQVDPRVNNRLVANWVDVAYLNKSLGEALWKFRHTIVKRSELLNSIIN